MCISKPARRMLSRMLRFVSCCLTVHSYSDAHGVQQGPFTAVQICEWYHAKLIDGRVRLRPHFPARGKRAAVETSALTTTEAPFSPVHRAGNLYVADVVGDVYLRERVTWGMRALLLPSDNDKVRPLPALTFRQYSLRVGVVPSPCCYFSIDRRSETCLRGISIRSCSITMSA